MFVGCERSRDYGVPRYICTDKWSKFIQKQLPHPILDLTQLHLINSFWVKLFTKFCTKNVIIPKQQRVLTDRLFVFIFVLCTQLFFYVFFLSFLRKKKYEYYYEIRRKVENLQYKLRMGTQQLCVLPYCPIDVYLVFRY